MSNSVLIIKVKLGQSEAEQKISIKIINGIIMVQTGNNLKVSKAFCLFFFFFFLVITSFLWVGYVAFFMKRTAGVEECSCFKQHSNRNHRSL